MDARQVAFRAQYQAKIPTIYNGWAHGAWIFGFGIAYAALSLHMAAGVTFPLWLASFIAALVVSNLGEWWIHKHALHRRIEALRALWRRHTVEHHSYFTEARMTVDSHREYRIIFFPPFAIVIFALIHVLFGAIWSLPFGHGAMWAWMAGGMTHYLCYEVLHTCAHLPEYRLLKYLPFVNTMRRNHWVHHHQALMSDYNMNLTLPFADWLLGTSDLDRGLWGTLFNGYRMDRLKPEVAARVGSAPFPPGNT
ncbi:sterol desaturase family protein [Sinimarinibacterium sp. CAU 1509]|uniref:sterol desaturase family protein n=1 Tax=Sinimarinibacterium sp. CAU 1509 TaxID=2562283 RepID=UPI0010AD9C14|nr:sterol desaturase family protein [Sinimarinibacterium sp. CAU 1509]TJY59033.1 sterol desaturase family protein [Sinimarinibacterium sp. CAU 1509]